MIRPLLFMAMLCLLNNGSLSATEPKPLPKGEVSRIAFGSCAKHWQPQPIWKGVLKQKPDLWLFLGDNVYADTDGATAWLVSKEQLTGEWNRLSDKPEFQEARAKVPMMATWDNHDYGSHAGGGEFPVKKEAKEAFLEFWGSGEEDPRWARSGIYHSATFGPVGQRVQIILLDTKFNRSAFKKDAMSKEERLKRGKVGGYIPDADKNKTHLGAEQWAWLKDELKKPADVRLVCSSTQVIPDQKGMDEWGNFPDERTRLLDMLQTSSGTPVLLSGNVHFAELSKLAHHDHDIYELTSSGMTHVNSLYGEAPNRYRIEDPFIDLNFGQVDIDWGKRVILLEARDVSGGAAFSHTIKMK